MITTSRPSARTLIDALTHTLALPHVIYFDLGLFICPSVSRLWPSLLSTTTYFTTHDSGPLLPPRLLVHTCRLLTIARSRGTFTMQPPIYPEVRFVYQHFSFVMFFVQFVVMHIHALSTDPLLSHASCTLSSIPIRTQLYNVAQEICK